MNARPFRVGYWWNANAIRLTAALLPLCVLAGCTAAARVDLADRTGGSAALFNQFRAYDGRTGRPLSLAEVVRRCEQADVVLFGEQHSDAVCNQLEAQLLHALLRSGRPVALAMEFFEADTQAALDAYLHGRMDEPVFREKTRQNRDYVLAHRPLIEMCRAAHVPVIAANAPRRLVRAYRQSGRDYPAFRAGLDPTDAAWLPLRSDYLHGGYEQRFFAMMGGHGAAGPSPAPAATQPAAPETQPAMAETQPAAPETQPTASETRPAIPETQPAAPETQPAATQPAPAMPVTVDPASFYRSQLLWDDAMAESLANFRTRFPSHRVMLVVGVFHVKHDGGTKVKFQQRRPRDRVCTLVYEGTEDGRLKFDPEDRGGGDIVLYGIVRPSEKTPPMPPPTVTPPTAPAPPAEMPAPAMPTSAPAGPASATAPAATQPLVEGGGQEPSAAPPPADHGSEPTTRPAADVPPS